MSDRARASARPAGIDYFNRDHALHPVKSRAALIARRGMYARVLELARPTPATRILDVGVTPDVRIPYNNFFERWYPHRDALTICSVEDCSNLETEFAGVTFRPIVGDNLPAGDREFDLAVSFAVLEHVGDEARQRRFLGECARVAKRVVVYTPYRYFPIELHALLPLTHWLPAKWYRALWRRIGLAFWADEQNLNLLSLRRARRLVPPSGAATVRLIWTFGWPSHIEIDWRGPGS